MSTQGKIDWTKLITKEMKDAWAVQAVLKQSTDILESKLRQASAQVTALQGRVDALNDAVELDMATDEEIAEQPVRATQLKTWKTYRVLLGRVSTQSKWPTTPVWPTTPEPYTSETSYIAKTYITA